LLRAVSPGPGDEVKDGAVDGLVVAVRVVDATTF
jgi:hypothetical protein